MKIGIIACGAVVREMISIANRQKWDYKLTAVPAQLHNRPERIAPAVEKLLDEWAECFDLILLGYADCGTMGMLDQLIARYSHVVRVPGPHCYEFFGGDTQVDQAETYPGTFYLTDFLAHHFDGLVWRGLGLDRFPDLQESYFGNYTHLMYLRQLEKYNERENAQEAAQRLGLEYVEVDNGIDVLEKRLVEIVETHRMAKG